MYLIYGCIHTHIYVCLCVYMHIFNAHSPLLAAFETKRKTSYTDRNISTTIGDK